MSWLVWLLVLFSFPFLLLKLLEWIAMQGGIELHVGRLIPFPFFFSISDIALRIPMPQNALSVHVNIGSIAIQRCHTGTAWLVVLISRLRVNVTLDVKQLETLLSTMPLSSVPTSPAFSSSVASRGVLTVTLLRWVLWVVSFVKLRVTDAEHSVSLGNAHRAVLHHGLECVPVFRGSKGPGALFSVQLSLEDVAVDAAEAQSKQHAPILSASTIRLGADVTKLTDGKAKQNIGVAVKASCECGMIELHANIPMLSSFVPSLLTILTPLLLYNTPSSSSSSSSSSSLSSSRTKESSSASIVTASENDKRVAPLCISVESVDVTIASVSVTLRNKENETLILRVDSPQAKSGAFSAVPFVQPATWEVCVRELQLHGTVSDKRNNNNISSCMFTSQLLTCSFVSEKHSISLLLAKPRVCVGPVMTWWSKHLCVSAVEAITNLPEQLQTVLSLPSKHTEQKDVSTIMPRIEARVVDLQIAVVCSASGVDMKEKGEVKEDVLLALNVEEAVATVISSSEGKHKDPEVDVQITALTADVEQSSPDPPCEYECFTDYAKRFLALPKVAMQLRNAAQMVSISAPSCCFLWSASLAKAVRPVMELLVSAVPRAWLEPRTEIAPLLHANGAPLTLRVNIEFFRGDVPYWLGQAPRQACSIECAGVAIEVDRDEKQHVEWKFLFGHSDLKCKDKRFVSYQSAILHGVEATPVAARKLDVKCTSPRGSWTPDVQEIIFFVVKDIVAQSILIKHGLYGALYPSWKAFCDVPTECNAECAHVDAHPEAFVRHTLPLLLGKRKQLDQFYRWFHHDRQPYLAEPYIAVSFFATDVDVEALFGEMAPIRVRCALFGGADLPNTWKFQGVTVVLEGQPWVEVECCEVVRVGVLSEKPVDMSEEEKFLEEYLDLAISMTGVCVSVCPSYTIGPLMYTAAKRVQVLVAALLALPSLDTLVKGLGGPGYTSPPALPAPGVECTLTQLAFSVLDEPMESFVRHMADFWATELQLWCNQELLAQIEHTDVKELQGLRRDVVGKIQRFRASREARGRHCSLTRSSLVAARVARCVVSVGLRPRSNASQQDSKLETKQLDTDPAPPVTPLHTADDVANALRTLWFAQDHGEAARAARESSSWRVLAGRHFEVKCEGVGVAIREGPELLRVHEATLRGAALVAETLRADAPEAAVMRAFVDIDGGVNDVAIDVEPEPALVGACFDLLRAIECMLPPQKTLPSAMFALDPDFNYWHFLKDSISGRMCLSLNRSVVRLRGASSARMSPEAASEIPMWEISTDQGILAYAGGVVQLKLADLICKHDRARSTLLDVPNLNVYASVCWACYDRGNVHTCGVHAVTKLDFRQPDGGNDRGALKLTIHKSLIAESIPFASAYYAMASVPCTRKSSTYAWRHQPVEGEACEHADRKQEEVEEVSLAQVLRDYWAGVQPHFPLVEMLGVDLVSLSVPCLEVTVWEGEMVGPSRGLRLVLEDFYAAVALRRQLAMRVVPLQALKHPAFYFSLNKVVYAIKDVAMGFSKLTGTLVLNEAWQQLANLEVDPRSDYTGQDRVVYQTYENQRFILGRHGGWSHKNLLPTDRGPWTNVKGTCAVTKDSVVLPSDAWEWETDWQLDLKLRKSGDDAGWEYASDFPRRFSTRGDAWYFSVRRRRWIRVGKLKEHATTPSPAPSLSSASTLGGIDPNFILSLDRFGVVQRRCSALDQDSPLQIALAMHKLSFLRATESREGRGFVDWPVVVEQKLQVVPHMGSPSPPTLASVAAVVQDDVSDGNRSTLLDFFAIDETSPSEEVADVSGRQHARASSMMQTASLRVPPPVPPRRSVSVQSVSNVPPRVPRRPPRKHKRGSSNSGVALDAKAAPRLPPRPSRTLRRRASATNPPKRRAMQRPLAADVIPSLTALEIELRAYVDSVDGEDASVVLDRELRQCSVARGILSHVASAEQSAAALSDKDVHVVCVHQPRVFLTPPHLQAITGLVSTYSETVLQLIQESDASFQDDVESQSGVSEEDGELQGSGDDAPSLELDAVGELGLASMLAQAGDSESDSEASFSESDEEGNADLADSKLSGTAKELLRVHTQHEDRVVGLEVTFDVQNFVSIQVLGAQVNFCAERARGSAVLRVKDVSIDGRIYWDAKLSGASEGLPVASPRPSITRHTRLHSRTRLASANARRNNALHGAHFKLSLCVFDTDAFLLPTDIDRNASVWVTPENQRVFRQVLSPLSLMASVTYEPSEENNEDVDVVVSVPVPSTTLRLDSNHMFLVVQLVAAFMETEEEEEDQKGGKVQEEDEMVDGELMDMPLERLKMMMRGLRALRRLQEWKIKNALAVLDSLRFVSSGEEDAADTSEEEAHARNDARRVEHNLMELVLMHSDVADKYAHALLHLSRREFQGFRFRAMNRFQRIFLRVSVDNVEFNILSPTGREDVEFVLYASGVVLRTCVNKDLSGDFHVELREFSGRDLREDGKHPGRYSELVRPMELSAEEDAMWPTAFVTVTGSRTFSEGRQYVPLLELSIRPMVLHLTYQSALLLANFFVYDSQSHAKKMKKYKKKFLPLTSVLDVDDEHHVANLSSSSESRQRRSRTSDSKQVVKSTNSNSDLSSVYGRYEGVVRDRQSRHILSKSDVQKGRATAMDLHRIRLTFLRVTRTRFLVNYRGIKSHSIENFEGMMVQFSGLVYQSKLWTAEKLANRLKRDLIRKLISQLGSTMGDFLSYKFGTMDKTRIMGSDSLAKKKKKKKKKKEKDNEEEDVKTANEARGHSKRKSLFGGNG